MKASAFFGIFLFTVIGIAPLHSADPFVAPKFVKELKHLKQVKKQAADENKGVTFLLMEPGST